MKQLIARTVLTVVLSATVSGQDPPGPSKGGKSSEDGDRELIQTLGPVDLPTGHTAKLKLFNLCSGPAQVGLQFRGDAGGDPIESVGDLLAPLKGMELEITSSGPDQGVVGLALTRCEAEAFREPITSLQLLSDGVPVVTIAPGSGASAPMITAFVEKPEPFSILGDGSQDTPRLVVPARAGDQIKVTASFMYRRGGSFYMIENRNNTVVPLSESEGVIQGAQGWQSCKVIRFFEATRSGDAEFEINFKKRDLSGKGQVRYYILVGEIVNTLR